jgi:uncharacterized protein (DUF433 family)
MKLDEIPLSLRQHFDQTPDVLGGKLRLRGTRVSVEQVLELIEAGVTPVEIVRSFPSVTEQAIQAVEQLAAHCALVEVQGA